MKIYFHLAHQLHVSGLWLSHSRAPDELNADRINQTRYLLLANSRAPLHELARPDAQRVSLLEDRLYRVDRCYDGIQTLYESLLRFLYLNPQL